MSKRSDTWRDACIQTVEGYAETFRGVGDKAALFSDYMEFCASDLLQQIESDAYTPSQALEKMAGLLYFAVIADSVERFGPNSFASQNAEELAEKAVASHRNKRSEETK